VKFIAPYHVTINYRTFGFYLLPPFLKTVDSKSCATRHKYSTVNKLPYKILRLARDFKNGAVLTGDSWGAKD
jgi:hypothetical protein